MTTIYLEINGGERVSSDSLRVAVEGVSITNARPAEATVSWSGCVSPNPLAAGDGVVIARGEQVIFRGYVESVLQSAGGAGARVKALLKDALGVWQRRTFIRGQWWPAARYELGWLPVGPIPAPDWGNTSNTPECWLFQGYYWATLTLGDATWEAKLLERQTIPAALRELAYYATTAAQHYDTPAHGAVEIGDLDFGSSPLTPERRMIKSPVSCADWLVQVLAPQIDGWCRLDYASDSSTLTAGRYRDAAPVVLRDADILSGEIDPREVDRASGAIYTRQWEGDGGLIFPWVTYPSTAEWGMLGNLAVPLGSEAPTTPWASLEQAAASSMLARPVGRVEIPASGAADLSVGNRVTVGGVTLSVQRLLWRLDRDRVALTLGSARQLGVSDLESLRVWLLRTGGSVPV